MIISLGADHGGVDLKTALKEHLASAGHELIDHGTHGHDSVDYPDFAQLVGKDVVEGKAQFGVLVCTTGMGISISANKIKGVRSALLHNEDVAYMARHHNDANIACFGQKYTTAPMAKKFLDIFLFTDFEGGRHSRRIEKLHSPEQTGASC